MSIRPDEHALIASLVVARSGDAPQRPPLFDSLVQWGYATQTPIGLTQRGRQVLDELEALQAGKQKVVSPASSSGEYESPYQ